ncbi:Pepco domain-containing protein [Leptothoe sp. PORK10 BA2]|uniref:Pepco domain-containing protein n=1 Tax=Leptothoe sp. PORK10 BA2 TaxID=3110254 RepID=UPI002B21FC7C|nr:hypothetical protein [Leptothoe sp. PORK10 BA2]MEA5466660.1 hypothetical protein [Leptothoe sp. PORK10 BA2]
MADEPQLYIIAEVQETEAATPTEGRRDGSTDRGGGWGESPKRSPMDALTQKLTRKRVPLDAQALKTQMQGMLSVVNDLFDEATTNTGLQLNEVELSVEINAEGQLSLVGNGGKLGNSGGITLKFVRPET